MADVEFAGVQTTVQSVRSGSNRYWLRVRFSDEETPDDKTRRYANSFFALLKDVDPDDVDQDKLARSMQKRIREGGNLSPRGRQEVTMYLIQLGLDAIEEDIDIVGDVMHVLDVEVEERTTVRETPYDDMDYGDQS